MTAMMGRTGLLDFLSIGRPVAGHHPWPRYQLDTKGWRLLEDRLSSTDWTLMAEWAEPSEIHAAFRDEETGEIAVASHACLNQRFISLAAPRPGAIRMERAIQDLFGLTAVGLPDSRPWLDHHHWPVRAPLGTPRENARADRPPYPFLPAEGEDLHQIPVGPVHAGIIEPGHFRFHAQGETVVRLEARLGYVHRGVEGLMAGRPVTEAARLAARVSGDSTVAYSLAFAHAVEAALGIEAPPRARYLRALMAETERLANHLGDIGGICNDAAFSLMLAHMGTLREYLLAASFTAFGHRLMMDKVIPGGVAADLTMPGRLAIARALHEIRKGLKRAATLYDATPALLDRTIGTGVVATALVHRFGASGVIGRASGRGHDARKSPGYPPYDDLDFPVPIQPEGDVNARIQIRFAEARASLALIEQILTQIPEGPLVTALPFRAGEGMAVVEGFRGEIVLWLRLSETGRVVRCHPHDPSVFQWPLLEAAIEGNIVADFPLCNKSFNCSYAGHDL